MSDTWVRYSAEVETLLEGEQQIIDDIIDSMKRLMGRTHEKYGHSVRGSHAKSHGLAVGELTVMDNLPPHLAQGLFASGGSYPVIVRLANVPGEILPDTVNTQRGFSFKILGVEGPKISGHEGGTTQDFLLDTDPTFPMPNAKSFLLQQRTVIEHLSGVPTVLKEVGSTVARVTNEALQKLGTSSPMLDFIGDSRIHPLAEAYYSQAPLRYGDYIAKLAVVPVSAKQKELAEGNVKVDSYKDENALRTATVGYLKDYDAEFEVRVQLCTDLEKMPVENSNKEWSQEESPYLPVARIRLPRQDAYSEARQQYVEALSFSPSHSLEAFRPLGSIMRARVQAYPVLARLRQRDNHQSMAEPTSIDEVPA